MIDIDCDIVGEFFDIVMGFDEVFVFCVVDS